MYNFGNKLKIKIEGESHSTEIKAVLSGFPAGFEINMKELCSFMKRRSSGRFGTTKRQEEDVPETVSGISGNVTDGGDIVIIIKNGDIKPSDYDEHKKIPRPGHADFGAYMKYGRIPSGGGRFSGRMTAALCAAGGVALQYLSSKGVTVGAHTEAVGGVLDRRFDPCTVSAEELCKIKNKEYPLICDGALEEIEKAVAAAQKEGDTLGGIVECAAVGFPAGLGGELFDGLEGKIACALFAIPSVKGVEFGAGFAAADIKGSENNDPFYCEGGRVYTKTNNCGGILGGISDGMPILFRAAFKPIPSIGMPQESVDLEKLENTKITVSGRHDVCAVMRCVPVVEAVTALVLADMML